MREADWVLIVLLVLLWLGIFLCVLRTRNLHKAYKEVSTKKLLLAKKMEGLYAPTIGRLFKYYVFASLNWWFKTCNRAKTTPRDNRRLVKTKPYVSEAYQLTMLVVGALLLFVDGSKWFSPYLLVCIALYRPMEILLFHLNWLFVEGDPLHAHMRSLFMVLINILEIALFYTAAFKYLMPTRSAMPWEQALSDFSSNLISLMTLNLSAPRCDSCCANQVLWITETVTGSILILVVVANLAGQVVHRQK